MTGILSHIRDSRVSKVVAVTLTVTLLSQLVLPGVSWALTSGPTQPEYGSFAPVETTEMVDLYSGDFSYNIPLLSVPGPNGGYPLNLSYHSNIGMDEEASWVGLGWNINVGAINRNLRGLPDDFKNKTVTEEVHLKRDWTLGIDFPRKRSGEAFGLGTGGFGPSFGLYYNSYRGLGYNISQSLSLPIGGNAGSLGANFSFDSQGGLSVSPSLSLGYTHGKAGAEFNIGASINSRAGFQGFSFTSSVSGGKLDKAQTRIQNNKARITGDKAQKIYNKSGFSSTLSFNPNYNAPSTTIPMINRRFDIDFKLPPMARVQALGKYTYGIFFASNIYYEDTRVANGGITNSPAYGYMYMPEATDNALQDYLRNGKPYSKEVPYLSTSNLTYDLFSISGQGTGGMFRPHLGNVGILQQPQRKTAQDGHRFNLEVAIPAPPIFYVGAGYSNRNGYTSSGSWQSKSDYDNVSAHLKYGAAPVNDITEQVYFKGYGEKTADLIVEDIGGTDKTRYEIWNEQQPLSPTMNTDNGKHKFDGIQGVDITGGLVKQLDERVNRSTQINVLTKTQSQEHGFSKDYTFTAGGSPTPIDINTICTSGCEDDIFEIQVLQPDGTTYIYGLPVYNWTQAEASFSVTGEQVLDKTRVELPGDRYSKEANEYYSKKTIPEYPTSWLLTGIVGPDYVDRTNNGITEDDFGYWVLFQYNRKYENYRWRAPYTDANYMANNKNDDGRDDIGSYLYGEKDVYYLSSVRTKTHIAVFNVSDDRDDALGAQGELATAQGTQKQFKLTDVSLYTWVDFDLNGGSAVPLKTVEFKYHDDLDTPTAPLCAGVDNSSDGKLTLKELYFKYNGSEKGSLSPYKFEYGETDGAFNPVYNVNNIDRWGNYKHNQDDQGDDLVANYPFEDFPYTNQWDYDGDGEEDQDDVDLRNGHASAWHLRQIKLPTGGIINIDYEQDDYAYVEGKPAMQMFDVVSVGPSLGTPTDRSGNNNASLFASEPTSRVYVRLPEHVDTTGGLSDADVAAKYFADHYLKGMDYVYFNAFVTMPFGGEASSQRDHVSGYASVAKPSNPNSASGTYGLLHYSSSAYYDYAYFDLVNEKVKMKGSPLKRNVHPFSKAAWYYVRGNRPDLLTNAPPEHSDPLDQVLGFLNSITGFLTQDLPMLAAGYENYCLLKKFSDEVGLNGRTIVRLYNPKGIKYGGGSRVKQITISDEWEEMNGANGGENSLYGQEYDYTIFEHGRLISSGVAYEPSTGGEESSLRQPVKYVNSLLFKTDETLFMETPIMEEYYPSPTVGYCKVTVKSIGRDYMFDSDQVQSDEVYAPYMVHEFYTPKDFPVIAKATQIENNTVRRPVTAIVYSQSVIRKAAAQGFTVILNDMAGKPKAVSKFTTPNTTATRSKKNNLLYKEEYRYKTTSAYSDVSDQSYELDCKVNVVLPDGSYKMAYMGQTEDVFVELHEDYFKTSTKGFDVNFIGPIPPVIPFIPIPIPNFSKGENSLKTVVNHKIIYKTGILEKTIVTDEKAGIETENLAFDALSGQPILTRMNNEYRDNIYALNYPAYWYYDRMGPAYENLGYRVSGKSTSSDGWINLTTQEAAHFVVGDEIYTNGQVYNVYKKDGNQIQLLDAGGLFIANSLSGLSLEIIRSGRRNLVTASAGATSMQTVTYTAGGSGNILTGIDQDNDIINASAVEFDDDWQRLCANLDESVFTSEMVCNYSQEIIDLMEGFIPNVILPQIGQGITTNNIDLCSGGQPSAAGNWAPSLSCCPSSGIGFNYFPASERLQIFIHSSVNCGTYGCSVNLQLEPGHSWQDVNTLHLAGVPVGVQDQNSQNLYFEYNVYGSRVIHLGSTFTVGAPRTAAFCPLFYECTEIISSWAGECDPNNHFNPFKQGVKGIWRPKKSYAYHIDRSYTSNNIRTDGHFVQFDPFDWQMPSNNNLQRWVEASEITKISPYSYELENKDALGIYSAALYGYDNTLVTAVAANARYNEIAYDSFEEYGFPLDGSLCGYGHWDFRLNENFMIDLWYEGVAHTGTHSCRLSSGIYSTISRRSFVIPTDNCNAFDPESANLLDNDGYKGNECQCINKHAFIQGKKYLLSAWVKNEVVTGYGPSNPGLSNNQCIDATITYENASGGVIGNSIISILPGHVEGWSKMEGSFIVPINAHSVIVEFKNGTPGQNMVYIDDIRIQPFNSEMKTFVYHPLNLRLVAELDGQNYATFYIYDEEGKLVKINKETVDGIRTLTESRMHTVPTN